MATQHKTVRSASIYSPTIRAIWVYLHEKRTKDGNKNPIAPEKQKYEFVGLIPKLDRDPAKCANYMLFANVAMGLVPQVPEWGGNYPSPNWPIKDGDAKASKYPFMAGHWVINFSGNFPPKVALLQNGKATEIPAQRIGTQEVYKSGDYCIVSTYAFTYDNQSKGIKFDMEGVLFVAPGEPIGAASRSADQIFEGLNTAAIPAAGSPMPMPTAPQAYAPPAPPAAPQPQYAAPPAAPPSYAPPVAAPPLAPAAQFQPAGSYAAPPSPPVAAPGPLPPLPAR